MLHWALMLWPWLSFTPIETVKITIAALSGKTNNLTVGKSSTQDCFLFRAPLKLPFYFYNSPCDEKPHASCNTAAAFVCLLQSWLFLSCLTGPQAVRVTKPNIPESIRRNYELMWVFHFFFPKKVMFPDPWVMCCVMFRVWCSSKSPRQVRRSRFKSVCGHLSLASWITVTVTKRGNWGFTLSCRTVHVSPTRHWPRWKVFKSDSNFIWYCLI